MKLLSILFVLCCYLLPAQLWASSTGKIEAMQMPAWITHPDGLTQPLKPGSVIKSGDQIVTGETSRLLIRLREGSHVRVGPDAQLDFNHHQSTSQTRGIFNAYITIVKGAFRFTTTSLSKNKKRDISVKLGVIKASTHGTDFWGRVRDQDDLVCLLEGSITVQRDGEPEFTIKKPLSYYLVPDKQSAAPIQIAPIDQLAQWTTETELLEGAGVLSILGKWSVNLMSLQSIEETRPILKQFADAGYAAEVLQFISMGRNWYRIQIKGFKSKADAEIFATMIDGLHGAHRPWVEKS